MKNNNVILISAIILSLSLIFSAVYVGYSIDKAGVMEVNNKTTESLLMNSDQASEFIGIPVDTLITTIKKEKIEKYDLTRYDTYRFIPYLVIDGVMYFNKGELEKWAAYKTINR